MKKNQIVKLVMPITRNRRIKDVKHQHPHLVHHLIIKDKSIVRLQHVIACTLTHKNTSVAHVNSNWKNDTSKTKKIMAIFLQIYSIGFFPLMWPILFYLTQSFLCHLFLIYSKRINMNQTNKYFTQVNKWKMGSHTMEDFKCQWSEPKCSKNFNRQFPYFIYTTPLRKR